MSGLSVTFPARCSPDTNPPASELPTKAANTRAPSCPGSSVEPLMNERAWIATVMIGLAERPARPDTPASATHLEGRSRPDGV